MRAHLIGAAIAVGLMSSAAMAQQSPLDGPLAAPGEAPAVPKAPAQKPHKPAHHAKAKPTKIPAATQDGAVPPPTAGETPVAHATAPADALDLGMKWSGTSDGSAQTHYQNGLNGAFGTGAEVGMKLHF